MNTQQSITFTVYLIKQQLKNGIMGTDTEPRIHTEEYSFGDLILKLEGEQYKGLKILDTKVTINGEQVCWITWVNKYMFLKELENTISKYSI